MQDFGMFTKEGNELVQRIVAAGQKLAVMDGTLNGWAFAERQLEQLAAAEGYEEATDTAVRETVYSQIVFA
mgnify:CR=1 FL=1